MISDYTKQRINEALSNIGSAIGTLDTYIADLDEPDLMEQELDELRGSYENLKQEWTEMKESEEEEEDEDEDEDDEDDDSDLEDDEEEEDDE